MPRPGVITVTHDPALRRFSARVEGQEAFLLYAPAGEGVLDYTSTFVPVSLRGRGIATAMVRAALDYARTSGYRVIPSCWFVRDFLARRADYAGLTAK